MSNQLDPSNSIESINRNFDFIKDEMKKNSKFQNLILTKYGIEPNVLETKKRKLSIFSAKRNTAPNILTVSKFSEPKEEKTFVSASGNLSRIVF